MADAACPELTRLSRVSVTHHAKPTTTAVLISCQLAILVQDGALPVTIPSGHVNAMTYAYQIVIAARTIHIIV